MATPFICFLDGGFLSVDVLVNFDPNTLCLECPDFVSVPLVRRSSGHSPPPPENPSNTLDQYTAMIDYQNSSSGFVKSVQKRDEQAKDSLGR